MAKARKALHITPPTSYELLAARLQRVINAPKSQLSRSAVLERHPEDSATDWDRILDEIAENDNVTIAYRDDGFVNLYWTLPR